VVIGYEESRKLKFSLVFHSIDPSEKQKTLYKFRINSRDDRSSSGPRLLVEMTVLAVFLRIKPK